MATTINHSNIAAMAHEVRMLHLPFSTREPYPTWYRNLPIVVYLPWRNLGCLGLRLGPCYIDMFRMYGSSIPIGLFVSIGGRKFYPISETRRWLKSIREHADAHIYDLQWEHGRMDRIPRWLMLKVIVGVVAQRMRYNIGRRICARYGHSDKVEHEDFVARTSDGDIDGGGVDWFCPRCGMGGRSWF